MPKGIPNALLNVITKMEEEIKWLTGEIKEMKENKKEEKVIEKSENFGLAEQKIVEQPIMQTDEMLKQVPAGLLAAAKEILGDKFTYECEPLPDQPSFTFTIIVPKEYTAEQGIDKRSRVIDNTLGINGVRQWCMLVKQNLIKSLGKQLTV